jgi:predicted AAA+ superfamily ATPase
VAVLNLFGLSDEEKGSPPRTPKEAFERIWSTSFPKLQGVSGTDAVDLYLSSYLQTYIERDVRELLGIQKRREFETFVRMCALRTGQVLNTVEIARDVGISPNTAKEWISLLEDSFSCYAELRITRIMPRSGLCRVRRPDRHWNHDARGPSALRWESFNSA